MNIPYYYISFNIKKYCTNCDELVNNTFIHCSKCNKCKPFKKKNLYCYDCLYHNINNMDNINNTNNSLFYKYCCGCFK